MHFSSSFEITCPDGYQPIPRPKDWNERSNSFNRAPTVSVTIRDCHESFPIILEHLIYDLRDSLEIQSALTAQLAKVCINDFLLGLTDNLLNLVRSSIEISLQSYKFSDLEISVSLSEIYPFQKMKNSSL